MLHDHVSTHASRLGATPRTFVASYKGLPCCAIENLAYIFHREVSIKTSETDEEE